jgi:hypothetical protein
MPSSQLSFSDKQNNKAERQKLMLNIHVQSYSEQLGAFRIPEFKEFVWKLCILQYGLHIFGFV